MDFFFASGTGVLAVACGMSIAQGAWKLPVLLLTLLAIVWVALWGNLSVAAVLVAAALFQAPIARIGSVPGITLAEFAVPPVLVVLYFESIRRGRGRSQWGIIEKAIVVYAIVLAVNLLRSTYLLTTISRGVNRAYYDYFVALGIFAAVYSLIRWRRIETARMIRLLYVFAVVGTLGGVIVVAVHLPVNLGNLRYSVYDYPTGAVRAGFLEVFGAVGLAVAITHQVRYRILSIALFGGALILSGGRAATAGAVLAVVIYLAVITRKNLRVIAVASMVGCVIAVVSVWAWPTIRQQPQLQRFSAMNSQTFGADGRQLIYDRSVAEFERHPLLGTGLGVPSHAVAPDAQMSSDPNVTDYYRAQLEVGGHATYAALLKNFGLAAAIPFFAALAAAVVGTARSRDRLGGFFFVALVTQTIAMVVGGNGSDPLFFFLLGTCAAWLGTRGESGAQGEDGIPAGSQSVGPGTWPPGAAALGRAAIHR